jgi:hypothetical protein
MAIGFSRLHGLQQYPLAHLPGPLSQKGTGHVGALTLKKTPSQGMHPFWPNKLGLSTMFLENASEEKFMFCFKREIVFRDDQGDSFGSTSRTTLLRYADSIATA